jgi:hypothetical protein
MKMPVFVFSKSDQIGNGNYVLTACFVKLGVHVPYSIYCHSENEYLNSVGRPRKCDDSCYTSGHMEDFGKERGDDDYSVEKIIEAASSFCRRKLSKKVKK